METQWIVIGGVLLAAIVLVVYLIRQNNKDEKDVTAFFNRDQRNTHEEDSERNDER